MVSSSENSIAGEPTAIMGSTSGLVQEEKPRVKDRRLSGWLKKLISFPVLLAALLMGAAGFQAHLHLADPDTWWHALVGQLIMATGHFPTHDIFSFTVHGNPWIAYEWLGEVIIGLVAKGWGVSGLLALLCVLAAAIVLLLYIYGTVATGNVKASFAAAAVLLPLTSVFFTLRPQLIGYAYLGLLLILMEGYRQGREKVLWAIPPLFLVWVNTHGSFFLGLGILGVFWLCGVFEFDWNGLEARRWSPRQSRNLLLTILASILLMLLTPYGAQLAAYPIEMAVLQPLNINSIQEWQAVNMGTAWGIAFLLLLLGLFLVQLFFKPRFRLFDLVFLLATIVASALHIRFIIILIFAIFPWLVRLIARWFSPYDPRKDKYALNVAFIAVLAFSFAYFFPSQKKINARLEKSYPLQAIAYLKSHAVPGPMMNFYGWGGYLIWTFGNAHGSSHPVFIDGRADIYEYGGVLKDYMDLMGLSPNTPLLLAKYNIRSVFIPPDSSLSTYLKVVPGWSLVYQDKIADIFVFRGSYPTPKKAGS